MIIVRPSRVREDSEDSSSLPARTGNNSLLLALWSWRSWGKRQEFVAPPAIPPSLSPAVTTPSSLPVFTSYTHPLSSSDEPDYTPSSSGIPLETTSVSTNTPPPKSTPFWTNPPSVSLTSIYPTESSTETTPTISISDNLPALPSAVIPTNTELEETDDGLSLNYGLSSEATGMSSASSDSAEKRGNAAQATHNMMVGAVVVAVLVICLLVLGVVFYRRRRVSRKPPTPVFVAPRPTFYVPPLPIPPHTTARQEVSVVSQNEDSFLDLSPTPPPLPPRRESVVSITIPQGHINRPARCSQISMASSISRSIRFAVSGSYNSSAGSRISRTAMSITAVDGTHGTCDEPHRESVSPWARPGASTPSEYSASWRGTNISNIINAARGIQR